ncbi:unnamed protein product [Rotaria sp. Silwood1]|nr:unnamed protein product [Rotaria sp. Silwood1]
MDHQKFMCIIVLLFLTINSSLTISSIENDLQKIFNENDNNQDKFQWRRLSELNQPSPNTMNNNKKRPRLLKYDFLLHQWVLRKKS